MAYTNKSRGCNMTRQHFEKIAQTVYDLRNITDAQRKDIALSFADSLQGTNGNFKRGAFLDACMGQ